jgi:hypothetical protein
MVIDATECLRPGVSRISVMDGAARFYPISTRPVEVSVEVSTADEPTEPGLAAAAAIASAVVPRPPGTVVSHGPSAPRSGALAESASTGS